jgi:hypothetical protein
MHITYDETVNVLGDTSVTATIHTDQGDPETITETDLQYGADAAIRARLAERLTERGLQIAFAWEPTRHPRRTKRQHPVLWKADLQPLPQSTP